MGQVGTYRYVFFTRVIVMLLIASISLLINGQVMARKSNKQDIFSQRITLLLKNVSLETVLHRIEDVLKVKFHYSPSKLNVSEIVSIDVSNTKLSDILDQLLPNHIEFSSDDGSMITLVEKILRDNNYEASAIQPDRSAKSTITGTVIDETTHLPLAGVTVVIKGTMSGTSSDTNGKFKLQAETGNILLFSFIGFKSEEVMVNDETLIDISLKEDVTSFNTVIINAGYYDVQQKEKTGSIEKVTSEIISKQPITNPLGALQGRMPGVFIAQTSGIPGGNFNIQIRGRNSLRSDGNEPLYIVDGVPFSSEKVSAAEAAQAIPGAVSPLTSLNTADIESIEVLKDADATAIYGSRGANGVVLITTKKGKAGKTKFDLNIYNGAGKAPQIDVLNTHQYLEMRREAFANDGITTYPATAYDINGAWDTTRYTNWQKMLIGNTAKTASIQSSLSGGSELTQFLFSTGYRRETSVFPGDFAYQKGSAHLSVNHKSSDRRFSFNTSVSGTLDKNNQVSGDYTNIARYMAPDAPALYDENGNLNWQGNTWTNPLAALQRGYEGTVSNFVGNVVLGYEVLPGLQIKSSFGLNSISSKEYNKVPSTSFPPVEARTSADAYVIRGLGNNQSWVIEPQISWNKDILKGKLSVLAGSTVQEQQLSREASQFRGFPSNALLGNLASSSIVIPYSFVKSLYRYAAVFGRLNFNWNSRYILNLTFRRDGSSRFGPGRQFANFGAAGAAWIFSNESFAKNALPFLSFGKLRAGYGTTGSDQIGDYQFIDTYSTTDTQYQNIKGLAPTRLFNPDFAWETNQKIEGAIELGFAEDRVTLNISYYRNRSSNQLVNYTLPLTTGFNGILSNLNATVQNSGWEAVVITDNLPSSLDLKWTTSFNFTLPRNKLIAFPNIAASSYANTYAVGESIYVSKVYESTGVDPETGIYTFTDFDGDGLITSAGDQKKTVFFGQNYYGGFNNSFTWKGFSLDVFFQYVNQTGRNYRFQSGAYGRASNMVTTVLEETRWKKPGDVATIQRFSTEADAAATRAGTIYGQSSDATISDASFIRLKNVSLSYQLPTKWTKQIMCRFYMQAQNLFIITGYKGYDPESQITRIAPLKMLTAGLQVTL